MYDVSTSSMFAKKGKIHIQSRLFKTYRYWPTSTRMRAIWAVKTNPTVPYTHSNQSSLILEVKIDDYVDWSDGGYVASGLESHCTLNKAKTIKQSVMGYEP